jgi:hypothetical protein
VALAGPEDLAEVGDVPDLLIDSSIAMDLIDYLLHDSWLVLPAEQPKGDSLRLEFVQTASVLPWFPPDRRRGESKIRVVLCFGGYLDRSWLVEDRAEIGGCTVIDVACSTHSSDSSAVCWVLTGAQGVVVAFTAGGARVKAIAPFIGDIGKF